MNIQNSDLSMIPEVDSEATTAMATETTLLNPRFYTTDFDELDRLDVSSIRPEWDTLIAQMKSDPNKGHFKKNADWDQIDWAGMDPKLRVEFIDFLVSSCTAEFSGCVLYKEMKRRGNNPDICELFNYMARDEARHAGFINDALREAGVAVNLGFLTKAKKYTYFGPSSSITPPICLKRLDMRAISPSTAIWRRTPTSASTPSSSGSRSGAMMSSAMARLLPS